MASIMRCAGLLLLLAAAGWTTGTLPARSEAPDIRDNQGEQVASPGEQPGDSDIDWSQLDVDGFTLTEDMPPQVLRSQRPTQTASGAGLAWTSHDQADGSVTAPGLGRIWDKTALEGRIDPARNQTMLDTSLSKSLPLSDGRYALTLRNGYNIIQQDALSVPGIKGTRHYNTDQSARLNLTDTGTSVIAGQSLSSTDNKWIRRIGAEQKLSDGLSITGAVSETPQGPLSASLTAAFKRKW